MLTSTSRCRPTRPRTHSARTARSPRHCGDVRIWTSSRALGGRPCAAHLRVDSRPPRSGMSPLHPQGSRLPWGGGTSSRRAPDRRFHRQSRTSARRGQSPSARPSVLLPVRPFPAHPLPSLCLSPWYTLIHGYLVVWCTPNPGRVARVGTRLHRRGSSPPKPSLRPSISLSALCLRINGHVACALLSHLAGHGTTHSRSPRRAAP